MAYLCCVCVLTVFNVGRAALLFYEPFSTTVFTNDNMKLGRIIGPWTLGNTIDAYDGWSMVRSAAALSYSGLVTSNGSRGVARIPNTYAASRNIGAQWATAVTSGSVYCSFLVNVVSAPETNRALLVLSYFASGNISKRNDGCGAVVWLNPNRQLQLGKYSTSVMAPGTTAALELGVTYLVVLKYTFGPGSGDDEVALYLNPPTAAGEPNTPTISTTAGTDSTQMKSVWLPQGQAPEFGSYTGEILMDEIRVGTEWSDVVPWDGTVPPTAPYITEVRLDGNSLVLRGTNGPANVPYVVLATTNLAEPVCKWQPVATNVFGPRGEFEWTESIPAGCEQRYYRLLVGTDVPVLVPPVIVSEPDDVAVAIGQNATFSVTATGTAPLRYWWYFNTNTLVQSGASATLTITNAQLSDAGMYSVTVSNPVGVVSSRFATLVVTGAPPVITLQPTDQTVMVGETVVFSVTASGTAPLHYQWYYNTNTVLAGQTNSTLILNNVQTNQSGKYSVTVTNLYGATTSVFATLLVTNFTSAPVITVQPVSQSVAVGQTAVFSVTAVGTQPLRYQWYFNTNTPLAWGTNATLTITNVQLSHAGKYSVTVSNIYGVTTSAFATLTVSEQTPQVKPRVIANTDGEVDDRSSMIRFLMYSCDYDVAGIVQVNSRYQPDGHSRDKWIEALLVHYHNVRSNLLIHNPDYPTTNYLLSVLRAGNENRNDLWKAPPDMATKNTPGEQLIIQTLLDDDPRPVHVLCWGGANTVASALWRLKFTGEYTSEQFIKAASKIRIYCIWYQDGGGGWIQTNVPEAYINEAYRWDNVWDYQSVGDSSRNPTSYTGSDAYLIFPAGSENTNNIQYYMNSAWLSNNVKTGHGPLGAAYPQSYVSEGDTPSFLHLINNGLEAHLDYTLGGWGGRSAYDNPTVFPNHVTDKNITDDGDRNKMYWRWIPAAQNDFAARMDWCVATNYAGANHQPVARVVGSLKRDVSPGQTVVLDASPSYDPDGNALIFNWWQYYDADSATNKVTIVNSNSMSGASFVVPNEPGKQVHIILQVTDNGTPPLTGYQRIIYNIK